MDSSSGTCHNNGNLKLNFEKEQGKANAALVVKSQTDPLLQFILETEEEKRTRRHSLWIMYFTTFLQSVGGSIVVTGMWPYLQQLDKDTNKEWFGWVVAANPLGQLISSPLIGWVCNRLESTRSTSIFCLIVFILSNCWYALLPLHGGAGAKWFILVARFFVGISSGSITACRTFLTQGTLVAERTASISHLSLSQALGFVLGPVGQLALKPLGETGFFIAGRLQVNMYTAVGWLTATLGLINVIFFHPKFFHESDIAIREAQGRAKISERDEKVSVTYNMDNYTVANLTPDYIGISSIVYTFFIVFFNFVLLETLGTPVSMDQFGWSAEKAITVVGLTMIISSVVSTSLFFLIPILAKRFDERILLIVLGIVPMTIGRAFFFPFSKEVAPMRRFGCIGTNNTEFPMNESFCGEAGYHWSVVEHGCPESQTWCFEIPVLSPVIVAIGYAFCTLGFPFCIALSQTIFSKMLGPRPQGVWMGGLTSVSSLSRVVGPIFVTYIYTKYGTIATSGTAIGLMATVFLLLVIIYKRLVPLVR